MAITHSNVKAPGQKLFAVADWNAAHAGTSPPEAHGNAAHTSVFITGAQVPANETDPVFTAWDKDHADLSNVSANQHHSRSHVITGSSDHTSTATAGQMLKADANGLPIDATNTDAAVSAAVTASHARQHAITTAADHTSTATAGKILKADANGLPIDATNTDADVSDAVTKKHAQGTDQALDTGGANEVTAANAKDAVTKKHAQGTDQGLDTGGANAVTAANCKTAYDHSQDNTQAHSDYLINNGNDTTSGVLKTTADQESADTEYFANILYGTDADPPAANTVARGSIYVQYTA